MGADQDEALDLAKSIVVQLVRTGSQYYNQKTDVDIRIVEEPVTIPSLTAWPRFVAFIIGTALFFTVLFFLVYGLIERLFPKRRELPAGNGEYVISPETFKPRQPAYWVGEDHAKMPETATHFSEESIEAEDYAAEVLSAADTATAELVEPSVEIKSAPVYSDETVAEPMWPTEPVDYPEEYIEEVMVPEVIEDEVSEESDEAESPSEITEAVYAGYVSHAAAPDNLPIVDESITPLQGAQARLMKADIDATAEAYAVEAEAVLLDEPAGPQTHEPTPDEYRRRLNELLSGKM